MTYLINGRNTRAGLRGSGPVGTYHLAGLAGGGLGDAQSNYDTQANAMRTAGRISFQKPDVIEANILRILGPRPPSAKESAVQKAIVKRQECAARGGVFDPSAPDGCRILAAGSGGASKSNMLLYAGGAALLGLLVLSQR